MTLKISNRDARRLWLTKQGLARQPAGALDADRLLSNLEEIGFVQLDTIRVIARAHDHILWSRNQNYREGMLDELVKDRRAFEHFTHDASVIPMDYYPYWRRQFGRMQAFFEKGRWREAMPSPRESQAILKRIEKEGPLSTRHFEAQAKKTKHAWGRPPHKYALDFYWYAGVLSTCHRRNFIKHYDLAERIIPGALRAKKISDAAQVDWLCTNALARMGFASEGDIQRFWDAMVLAEVKAWVKKRRKDLIDVEIDGADGAFKGIAFASIEDEVAALKAPTSRLRMLNPFDPVIRDRNRLKRLFGFDYRIEIFVPAAKRQYGYYVYPLLEGERMVGRIEAKADRKQARITVENLWWEPGVKPTPARRKKLDAELDRIARFIGARDIEWNSAKK